MSEEKEEVPSSTSANVDTTIITNDDGRDESGADIRSSGGNDINQQIGEGDENATEIRRQEVNEENNNINNNNDTIIEETDDVMSVQTPPPPTSPADNTQDANQGESIALLAPNTPSVIESTSDSLSPQVQEETNISNDSNASGDIDTQAIHSFFSHATESTGSSSQEGNDRDLDGDGGGDGSTPSSSNTPASPGEHEPLLTTPQNSNNDDEEQQQQSFFTTPQKSQHDDTNEDDEEQNLLTPTISNSQRAAGSERALLGQAVASEGGVNPILEGRTEQGVSTGRGGGSVLDDSTRSQQRSRYSSSISASYHTGSGKSPASISGISGGSSSNTYSGMVSLDDVDEITRNKWIEMKKLLEEYRDDITVDIVKERFHNDLELMKQLVTIKDSLSRTLLHYAIVKRSGIDVIKYFLEVEKKNGNGEHKMIYVQDKKYDMLPLHYAAGNGSPAEIVKLLLDVDKEKRTLHTKDNDGWMPISYAKGNVPDIKEDVIQLLEVSDETELQRRRSKRAYSRKQSGTGDSPGSSPGSKGGHDIHLPVNQATSMKYSGSATRETAQAQQHQQARGYHDTKSVVGSMISDLTDPDKTRDEGYGADGATDDGMIDWDDTSPFLQDLWNEMKRIFGEYESKITVDIVNETLELANNSNSTGNTSVPSAGAKSDESKIPSSPDTSYSPSNKITPTSNEAGGKVKKSDSTKDPVSLLMQLVCIKGPYDRTLLLYACAYGAPIDVCELLLHADIDNKAIHIQDKYYGLLPIHYASENNAPIELIDMLLEADVGHKTIHVKDYYGKLPVHNALETKASTELIKALLDADIDNKTITNKDNVGWVPLHIACVKSASYETFQLLLDKDINKQTILIQDDLYGRTPVTYAVENKLSIDILRLLLDADEDNQSLLYITDNEGRLPLHTAAQTIDLPIELYQLLVERDVEKKSINVKDSYDMIPLQYYEKQQSDQAAETLNKDAHEAKSLLLTPSKQEEQLLALPPAAPSSPIRPLLLVQDELQPPEGQFISDGDDHTYSDCLMIIDIDDADENVQQTWYKMKSLFERKKQKTKIERIRDIVKDNEDMLRRLVRIKGEFDDTLLNIAIVNSIPTSAIKLLLDADESSKMICINNTFTGLIPLHNALISYGCGTDGGNDSNEDLVKLLISADTKRKSVHYYDKSYKLPIHIACERNVNANIVRLLLEADDTDNATDGVLSYKRTIYVKDGSDMLPINYMLGKQKDDNARKICHLLLDADKTGETFYCMEEDESNHVFEYISDNKHIQERLNTKSSERLPVLIMMADFFAHCALIGTYVHITDAFIREDNGNTLTAAYSGAIYGIVCYFFIREMFHITTKTQWNYFKYNNWGWSMLYFVRLFMVIASVLTIQLGSNANDTHRKVVLAAGAFVFLGLISYFNATFISFTRFIYGIQIIFLILIPFFIVGAVTLLAFAYMYFVSEYDEASCSLDPTCEFDNNCYCTFGSSLESVFKSSFTNLDSGATVLDILFSLSVLIILTAVAIAIVCCSWNDSSDAACLSFWKGRLSFLADIETLKRCFCLSESTSSKKKSSNNNYRSSAACVLCVVGLPAHFDEDDDDEISDKKEEETKTNQHRPIEAFCNAIYYGVMFVLGFLTLGILWPQEIRKWIFGSSRSELIVTNKKMKSELDEIKERSLTAEQDAKELKQAIDELTAMMKVNTKLISRSVLASNKNNHHHRH